MQKGAIQTVPVLTSGAFALGERNADSACSRPRVAYSRNLRRAVRVVCRSQDPRKCVHCANVWQSVRAFVVEKALACVPTSHTAFVTLTAPSLDERGEKDFNASCKRLLSATIRRWRRHVPSLQYMVRWEDGTDRKAKHAHLTITADVPIDLDLLYRLARAVRVGSTLDRWRKKAVRWGLSTFEHIKSVPAVARYVNKVHTASAPVEGLTSGVSEGFQGRSFSMSRGFSAVTLLQAWKEYTRRI